MRHIVLGFLITVALPATAQAPEAQLRYKCVGDKLHIEVAVRTAVAGTFHFVTPAYLCGPSI
jgi:hypothetical protein